MLRENLVLVLAILCEALTELLLRLSPQSEREWDDDDFLGRFDLY